MVDKQQNKRAVGTKQSKEYIKKLIQQIAIEVGVPVDLALAVAQHESGFNNIAVSPKNTDGSRDHGVFQLNDKYHKLKNVYDPEENIRYGIGMLKAGLDKNNGDIAKTLSDYNAGPNATGKGRKQGDAYAKKVMNLIPNFNRQEQTMIALSNPKPVKTADQEAMTGAAAPIGERLSDTQADYLNAAQRGIAQYASQPYDPSLGLALRQQRAKEYLDQFNRVVNETPMSLTPEQQQQILNNFAATGQAVQDMTKQTQDRIQQMTGANQYQPYEAKIRQAYEDQIARLQAANPYTRLSQVAPIGQIDPNLVNQQNQVYDTANLIARSTGLQEPINYAQRTMERAQQARDIAAMNATGLTPAEFVQGGIADYNTMSASLNAQNQALVSLYDRAMAGDQQAMQILGNLGQNANANFVTNQANAYKALTDQMRLQQEAAKANWDRRQQMLQGIQGLDPTMVAGANQIQGQNISTAGNMYNTGMNAGVNQGQNIVRYETGMIPNAANAQDEIKPISAQQYGSTLLSGAAMSNNPEAFQQALDIYGNLARQYGSFDPRFVQPIQTNTFLPN